MRAGFVGVVLVLAVLVAGCAESAPPAPVVRTTSVTSSSATVPPVPRPLDLAAHRDDPCLFSTADLGRLGFSGSWRATRSGGGCYYEAMDHAIGGVALKLSLDSSPLAAAYEHDADHYELFKPDDLVGYPAVVEAEKVADGTCAVVVGTADDQGLTLVKYPDMGAAPGDLTAACDRLRSLGLLTMSALTA